MNKLVYYIVLLLLPQGVFAIAKDSLNPDLNSTRLIHRLPEDFKDNYKGKEFVYEYEVDNTLSWGERFTRWLSHLLQRIFTFDSAEKAFKVAGYFFKGLYYLAIIAVIYLIARTLLRKEGNWIFGRKSDKLDITTDSLEVDLMATNFDALIKEAVKNKEYRLATRYYYLKTLKTLTERGIIEWDSEKTNYDYLTEIEQQDLQKQFQYISYIYSYSWYGEFELDTESYSEVERSFQTLFKSFE